MKKDQVGNVLRSNEVAERLQVSRTTLWRWARAGLLPPKRQIGPNVVGWLESEIVEWVAERPTCIEIEPTAGASE